MPNVNPNNSGQPQIATEGIENNSAEKIAKLDKKSTLTQSQLAELWILMGGDPGKADEASAVSMAESSGIVKNGNSCCKGIYALNTEVGVSNNACAYKPSCATKYAIGLSNNGTNWQPWEAWTNGHYKRFLGKSHVREQSPGISARGPAELVSNVLSPLAGIAAGIKALVSLINDLFTARFWVRTGKGILGFVLIVFALQGMAKATLGLEIPFASKLPI